MSALSDVLDRLAGRPLATVVHVHPDDPGLVDRYAALGARRVVWICADPAVLPGLRRLLDGRPWLTLVEAVVAPQAGPTHWLRYNVPAVNGLLAAGAGLQEFYPRLQLQERVPVQARALQTLLDEFAPGPQEGENLLVLETPGREDALLRSLRPECLAAFEWLLVRGARPGLLADGVDDQAAPRWLQERAWREVQHSAADEPLWPVTLLQFDRVAAERAALVLRAEAAEAELKAVAAARATAERDASLRAAEVSQLTQERDALKRQLEAVQQAKSVVDKTVAEHARQLEQLQAERGAVKAALDKAVAERMQQTEQLTKARDEYAKQATERQKRIVQLEAELADLAARHGMLQEELIKSEAHVELIADVLLRESLR